MRVAKPVEGSLCVRSGAIADLAYTFRLDEPASFSASSVTLHPLSLRAKSSNLWMFPLINESLVLRRQFGLAVRQAREFPDAKHHQQPEML
jgi:hypothetical protein